MRFFEFFSQCKRQIDIEKREENITNKTPSSKSKQYAVTSVITDSIFLAPQPLDKSNYLLDSRGNETLFAKEIKRSLKKEVSILEYSEIYLNTDSITCRHVISAIKDIKITALEFGNLNLKTIAKKEQMFDF